MVGKKFTDAEKLRHLENLWTPGKNSVFPSTQHGKKQLKFQFGWLENWKWLAYSKIEDGAYCKYCVLFSKYRGGKGSQLLGQLCTEPFNKWKHALEKFSTHEKTNYHQNSVIDFQQISSIVTGKTYPVYHQLNKTEKIQKENNRKIIIPVINSVILCGRQGIALRGHRDSGPLNIDEPLINEGNFRSLLRFFLKATTLSGDESFKLARENCTDETADISGVKQFALCARYYDVNEKKMCESFFKICSSG
ncbi:unnamed protein product [Macrosiphum euphorbiae]|uniref:TTF-type domain-containing protein n=1 Tax=Macrosiphum euphorbiae TaxID=13131 RepID=A0AAV0Y2T1_9HEMI|nr:unnamed protein product [Macrosiphum euphorbiae]